jgi:NAD(P)H-dependent FMN reductase
MHMRSIEIPILLGSARIGRQSLKVARFILSTINGNQRFDTELIDLGEYDFPMMEQRLSEMQTVPSALQSFSDKLHQADGLIIVSPEYKGGMPGALKNAFDYLKPGILRRKPVGICTVSSGGFGGLNCLMQLRLTVLALGGIPIPDSLPVSRVQEHFDESGRLIDANGTWKKSLMHFIDELCFYATALSPNRDDAGKTTP